MSKVKCAVNSFRNIVNKINHANFNPVVTIILLIIFVLAYLCLLVLDSKTQNMLNDFIVKLNIT